jgi:hypothetical protein
MTPPVTAALMSLALLVACTAQPEVTEDPLSYAGIESLIGEQFDFREERTASCMSDAGFDCYPATFEPGGGSGAPGGTDPSNRLFDFEHDVEYASRHGFGLIERMMTSKDEPGTGEDESSNDERFLELDQEVLEQLLAYERRAAVDHAECWQEHADSYGDVLRDAYATVADR